MYMLNISFVFPMELFLMLMISKVDKLNIINNYFQTNIILRILKLERIFRTYIRKINIYNNIVSIGKQLF